MHWGRKILIVYTAFVGVMIFMVVKSFHNTNDLVTDDYYADELKFQDQINATQNALVYKDSIELKQQGDKVELMFPRAFANATEGQVHFYRASDAKKDVTVALQLDPSGEQQFDRKQFEDGFYTVKISWKKENIAYYTEKNIML